MLLASSHWSHWHLGLMICFKESNSFKIGLIKVPRPHIGSQGSFSRKRSLRARSRTTLVNIRLQSMNLLSTLRFLTTCYLSSLPKNLKTVATAGVCIWKAQGGMTRVIAWLIQILNSYIQKSPLCGSYLRGTAKSQKQAFTCVQSTRCSLERVPYQQLDTQQTSAFGWSFHLTMKSANGSLLV